jgi:hypothetical protein
MHDEVLEHQAVVSSASQGRGSKSSGLTRRVSYRPERIEVRNGKRIAQAGRQRTDGLPFSQAQPVYVHAQEFRKPSTL